MQIQVPSIACDVRMSMTIKSSRPEQKAKTHEKLTWKILEENLVPLHTHYFFHLILRSPKFSQNVFPTKMKPGKCPEKKNGARKAKEEGGRRAKGKSQDCCVTFKPNKLSRNFAPAHAQTLEADICIWNKRPQSASLQMALGKF